MGHHGCSFVSRGVVCGCGGWVVVVCVRGGWGGCVCVAGAALAGVGAALSSRVCLTHSCCHSRWYFVLLHRDVLCIRAVVAAFSIISHVFAVV